MNAHSKVQRSSCSDSGAIAVIVAVMMVALLGVAALSVDAGALYTRRRQMQNAADAAALAGVQKLPGNPGAAQTLADQYAQENGVAAGDGDYPVTTTSVANDTISARVRDPNVGLFFARILGQNEKPVSAQAKAAVVSPATLARNVMPFGVLNGAFPFGQTRDLKFYAQDPLAENALSQLMYLTNPPGGTGGTNIIVDQIRAGGTGFPVYIGGQYGTGPQVNGQPIRKAVNDYIGANTDALSDIATVVQANPNEPPVVEIQNYDSPRLWICPVLDITSWVGVSPGDEIRVRSFVYLYIPTVVPDCPDARAIGAVGQPNPSLGTGNNAKAWLYCQVIRPLSPEEVAAWGGYDPSGAFAYRLVD